MSRRVHLIRHGETEGESSIRYHGRNDVALSDVGRDQVARLIPWLAAERFAAVLHSPLSRAVTSAEILVAGLEQPPATVAAFDGLAEVNFGAIEGMTAEEIEIAFPDWFVEWRAGRATGFPDGETFDGFSGRIAAAWDDLVAQYAQGDLLVVAHRGVIKRILVHALQLDDEAAGKLVIELASHTVLRCGPETELERLDQVPE